MSIWTLAVVGSVPGWSLLCGSWMMACWCAASMIFLIFLSDQLRLRVRSALIDSFPVQFLQQFEYFAVDSFVS